MINKTNAYIAFLVWLFITSVYVVHNDNTAVDAAFRYMFTGVFTLIMWTIILWIDKRYRK